VRNPYRPGAAATPRYLAGREDALRRFAATLRAAPELPANIRLTGLRGVGKTVLLKELERHAIDAGWATSRAQLEPRHNTEDDLASLLVGLCEQATLRSSRSARLQRRVKGAATAATGLVRVRFDDFQLSLSPLVGGREHDVVAAMYDATEAADRRGHRGLLLLLDEAQVLTDDRDRSGEHPLSLLIAAINALQEQELPIAIVLSGLPSLRSNLLKARTYSERMFRGEDIGSLSPDEAFAAFTRPLDDSGIVAAPDLVERVVDEVEGYPFFIQLWGAELWDAAHDADLGELTTDLLDQVEPDIYRRLDTDFYDGRFASLTPAEQDLLTAAASASYPPLRTADLNERTGKSKSNVNVLMGRLVDQGVLYRVEKGTYLYTAPNFHPYLQRRTRPPSV